MVKKSARYELFKSGQRGRVDVENKLEAMLDQMQTPDNLSKLFGSMSKGNWGKSQPGKMNFSDFEAKLNKAKEDYFKNSCL
jgi:hypothetical protein